jgi:hypothetical protein
MLDMQVAQFYRKQDINVEGGGKKDENSDDEW